MNQLAVGVLADDLYGDVIMEMLNHQASLSKQTIFR